MIKSRYSCRDDLVARLNSVDELLATVRQRNKDSFILQEFVDGDGWDVKVWIIGEDVFAARRRPALETIPCETVPLSADEIPREWVSMAQKIGRVFGLSLYGVDLVIGAQGPVAIDVNAFPGFRGVRGAGTALVALIEHLGSKPRSMNNPVLPQQDETRASSSAR
jgi:ribosomal protein S6--L-glutamate ligase